MKFYRSLPALHILFMRLWCYDDVSSNDSVPSGHVTGHLGLPHISDYLSAGYEETSMQVKCLTRKPDVSVNECRLHDSCP